MPPRVSDDMLERVIRGEATGMPTHLALDLRDARAAHQRDVDAANATIKRLQRELDEAVRDLKHVSATCEAAEERAIRFQRELDEAADERERCAIIVDVERACWDDEPAACEALESAAAAIRARGNERKGVSAND